MATPLQNFPEWNPNSVDGPAANAALARAIEQQVVLRFASAAAMDAAFTAAGVDPGGAVARLATDPGALYVHDGAKWRKHAPTTRETVGGSVTAEFNNARSVSVNITFPAGLFSAAPEVLASVATGAGSAIGVTTRVFNRTDGGASIAVDKADGTLITASIPIIWVATGPVA